jgi:ketosteroid isomerase-like protein
MSRDNQGVVRTAVTVGEASGRTLDQRFAIRFPRLAHACFRQLWRLPPRSRVRRAALARSAQRVAEAYNRRDLSAAVIGYHSAFEYRPGQAWVAAGLVEPTYRGLAGYRNYVATADEVWGGTTRLEPTEVIDLGNRFVLLAVAPMRAAVSGVALTQEYVAVATVRDGEVVSIDEYFDQREAFEAVGLSE